MQKLPKVNLLEIRREAMRSTVAVIGMAALWMSLFKQLLYPVLYAYYRTGDENTFAAQGVYSATLVIVTFALLTAHARNGEIAGECRYVAAVTALGIAGGAGVALRVFGVSVASIYVGSVLSAGYLPVHFVFWTAYARRCEGVEALQAAAFSFALFLTVLALLALAGANTVWVSITCPLASSAAALVCSHPGTDANRPEPDAELPACRPAPSDESASPVKAGTIAPANTSTPSNAIADAPQTALELPTGFAEAFNLSERETELAAYAHRNLSARRIASELFIAESTVYTHLKRIYRKAGVHSKGELIELIDSWR